MKQVQKSAILAAVILAFSVSITACGSTEENVPAGTDNVQTTETVTETEDTTLKPDIPELDYGGAEFRFYHNDYSNNNYDIISDGLTGEILNDAVYQRNIETEDKFNVKFNIYVDPGDIYGNGAINTLTAGDDAYEVVVTTGNSTMNLISRHLTQDLNSSMPYMDLTKPWWNQDFQKNMTIDGKLFVIVGDITHIGLESVQCIAFNRNLFSANDFEAPYDDVRNGTWTFDKFTGLIKDFTQDINGDGKLTLDSDQYGYIIHEYIMPMGYMFTNNVHICSFKDGLPYVDLDEEKLTNVTAAYKDVADANVVVSDATYGKEAIQVFMSDRALFADVTMRAIRVYFRDMKSDFGIIPLPKFDESVDHYSVHVGTEANIYAVPITTEKTEMISAILEYMAYYGRENIIPVYYDVILGDKLMRDQDSRDMLDIIRDSMHHDFGNWGGPSSLHTVGLPLINSKQEPASYLAANRTKMETELNKLLESVANAEG